jgi:hypothetical protein
MFAHQCVHVGNTISPQRKYDSYQAMPSQAAEKLVSYQGIALQLAEKTGVALDFGWRSGSPLR